MMTRNQLADLVVRTGERVEHWRYGGYIPGAAGFSLTFGLAMYIWSGAWPWLVLLAAGAALTLISPVGTTIGCLIELRRLRRELHELEDLTRRLRRQRQDDAAGPART